jgi:hypothetical protein
MLTPDYALENRNGCFAALTVSNNPTNQTLLLCVNVIISTRWIGPISELHTFFAFICPLKEQEKQLDYLDRFAVYW